MKKLLLVTIILTWGATALSAQTNPSPAEGWKVNTTASVEVGQMSLSNWAAGGESTFSLKGGTLFSALYDKGRILWHNAANFNYNFFKTKNRPLLRLNDNLNINSMFGYKLTGDILFPGDMLHTGVMANLFTQVAPGYDPRVTTDPLTGQPLDPGKGLKVGSFLSPGYFFIGAGFRYLFSVLGLEALNVIYAPISMQQTYIIDKEIRDLDKFASIYDNRGNTVSTSWGTSFTANIAAPLVVVSPALQNLILNANMMTFTTYQDPALLFDGTLSLAGKINKHLSALFSTRFVYNPDTDTDPVEAGRQKALQIMGNFGLGVNLTF